jgi:hypothetical protein
MLQWPRSPRSHPKNPRFNRLLYTGQIAHKGQLYPGQHPALILSFPELFLQIDADPFLLLQIGGIKPGGAQFLDERAVGPPVYRLLAVGANGEIAIRMNVGHRAIAIRLAMRCGWPATPRSTPT